MLHKYPPSNMDQINNIMDTCFAAAAYASKVEMHCTLNMLTVAFVFQRGMILNIPSLQIYFIFTNKNKSLLMNVYGKLIYVVEHLIINQRMKY